MDGKGCEGKEKEERGVKVCEKHNEGRQEAGWERKRERESGRETEGDRRRKSLRHG